VEAAISAVAERQHGVVALGQLQFLGLGRAAVAKRARTGGLHRIHRGVYAVRHPRLTARGRWMAATLAYGPNALLSHRSAATLWGIHHGAEAKPHITLPGRSVRARAGMEVHASITLTHEDQASHDGIPCTSPARTLVDLGDVANRRTVQRAVDQAEVLRLFDLRAVEEALGRAGRRRGAGVLRAVLGEYTGPTLTSEEFEERFLALCRAASLPEPEVNAWISLDDGLAYKADFLWREEGLVAETDGYRFHSSRRAFEHDRMRDQRLIAAGFTVVRLTWRQLTQEPDRVLSTVKKLLARLARP
jgi:very-short-patch-repair endonuclease/predicted transcriptional regulator of viral defense system